MPKRKVLPCQDVPRFWDAVRFKVDHSDGLGFFILTGSSVPPDDADIVHTGTVSLDSAAFSSENIALDFKEPQDGKLKFTATPAVDNAKSFCIESEDQVVVA